MTKRELLEALESYDMDEELNMDEFANPNMYEQIPSTYAEIEYDDFDDPEAIMGARFDDMNFMRYFER